MPEDLSSPARPGLLGLIEGLWARREIRFLIIGGANTVLGLVLFAAFHYVLGDVIPYVLLLVPMYAVAIPLAFTTQRIFVFDAHGNVWVDLLRYTMVQLGSVGLNALLLFVLVDFFSVPVLPAQAVTICVIVVVTYFSHLMFSFRRPTSEGEHLAEEI